MPCMVSNILQSNISLLYTKTTHRMHKHLSYILLAREVWVFNVRMQATSNFMVSLYKVEWAKGHSLYSRQYYALNCHLYFSSQHTILPPNNKMIVLLNIVIYNSYLRTYYYLWPIRQLTRYIILVERIYVCRIHEYIKFFLFIISTY